MSDNKINKLKQKLILIQKEIELLEQAKKNKIELKQLKCKHEFESQIDHSVSPFILERDGLTEFKYFECKKCGFIKK